MCLSYRNFKIHSFRLSKNMISVDRAGVTVLVSGPGMAERTYCRGGRDQFTPWSGWWWAGVSSVCVCVCEIFLIQHEIYFIF